MAEDRFSTHANTSNPITRSAAVVPGDGEIEVTRGLFVQGGGSLTIRLRDDDEDWTLEVGDQTQLPYRVAIVRASSTATGIRALY